MYYYDDGSGRMRWLARSEDLAAAGWQKNSDRNTGLAFRLFLQNGQVVDEQTFSSTHELNGFSVSRGSGDPPYIRSDWRDGKAAAATLREYAEEAAATPNITLDYSNAGDDPVAYLKQALEQVDGTAINDAAK